MTQAKAAPTAAAAFFQQRRAEFDSAAANRTLNSMRRGQTLHLQYRAGRSLWSLSDGRFVTPQVAALVTSSVLVQPADAALFPDLPGQCWRMK